MIITKSNINQFINGSIMDCSGKSITSIEYIPEGITILHCHNNQLNSLPNLPNGLIRLDCDNNQLTSLPNLPEGLIYLDCSGNNLPYPITINNFREHNKLLNRSNTIKKILNDNQ